MIEISDYEFEMLSRYVLNEYGIKLGESKKALITGRLQGVMAELGITNFTDYYSHVLSDYSGNSLAELVNRITTNHTFFMREAAHFDYFKLEVLPDLVKNVKERDIRIWSAGCSSGEEPYTIAMILADYFKSQRYYWDKRILATDISEKVLDMAKRGEYETEDITNLPGSWKAGYFQKKSQKVSVVCNEIRNEVIFRHFNLMNPIFPFKKKFHVIFCRNVMIYFDSEKKDELVNKFYDSLEWGGYLFIGHSETLDREKTKFKFVDSAVYRKI